MDATRSEIRIRYTLIMVSDSCFDQDILHLLGRLGGSSPSTAWSAYRAPSSKWPEPNHSTLYDMNIARLVRGQNSDTNATLRSVERVNIIVRRKRWKEDAGGRGSKREPGPRAAALPVIAPTSRNSTSTFEVLVIDTTTITITTSNMAAVQKPGRTDWAEDSEPDLATSIPPPQITRNKDGSETVVTVFINDEGKRVKRTQRIKRTVIKKKENPRVAERRQWPKMGPEAGKPAGPGDTTTLGENIVFRPQVGFKAGGVQEKAPEEEAKTAQLAKMKIKCRICQGDHFTTKCPFKDTMAPEGEAAGAPATIDDPMADDAGGATGPGGSYVPPHMRKGAAGASGGERMGGKYERDDLATLRVTNVSQTLTREPWHMLTKIRCPSWRRRTTCATCSSAGAASHACSWPRTERLAEPRALRSCRSRTVLMRRMHARRWMVSGTVT